MIGIVVARDIKKHLVRVQFPDRDNIISAWLPVGVKGSLDDYEYWLPAMNSQVACLMDEHYEFGVVVCAIYSDNDLPPVTGDNIFYKRFKDGTFIQYDRETHKLFADVKGTVDIIATGNITSTAPTWTHTGKLIVTQDIESGANIQAAGNVSDQGGSKTMAGMRQIFNLHNHPENGTGGGTTSQPNQGM